jgi:hypothetical protein
MLRGVKTERATKIDVISGDIVGAGKGVGFSCKTHERIIKLIKEKGEIEKELFNERRARAYEANAGFQDGLHPRPAQVEAGKCKDRVQIKRKRKEQSQGEMLDKRSIPENFAAP